MIASYLASCLIMHSLCLQYHGLQLTRQALVYPQLESHRKMCIENHESLFGHCFSQAQALDIAKYIL